MQEAHGDGRHAEGPQARRRLAHALLVELAVDGALTRDALVHLESYPAAGDGLGGRVARVPDVLLVAAPHFDFVAEALGDQQAGRGPGHLNHAVVRRRGAVHHRRGPPQQRGGVGQALRLGQAGDAGQDAVGLVLGGRRRLLQHDGAVGAQQDAVGEGPADVDPDAVAVAAHAPPSSDRSARSCFVAS